MTALLGTIIKSRLDRPRQVAALLKGKLGLDHAAHQAAPSTLNLKRPPSEAQARAGNYPKGHWSMRGLDFSIENPEHSHRRPEWPPLTAHYGYIRSFYRPARKPEDSSNRLAADTKLFGDAGNADAIRSKGFDTLSIENKRAVQANMLAVLHDPEILRSVIKSVGISVVNDFTRFQFSTEKLFRNPTMFFDRLALPLDNPVVTSAIARLIDAIAACHPNPLARLSAEKQTTLGVGETIGTDGKDDVTGGAGNRGSHSGRYVSTMGADGDQVDAFLKPGTDEHFDGPVFVIDQPDKSGGFDEHKVMIGWTSQEAAVRAYRNNYPANWPQGEVTELTVDELKEWLDGDTTTPIAKGDTPGHEFHGNQWTGSMGAAGQMQSMFARIAESDGGFTYSPKTGEPKSGYVLSIHPERSAAFDNGKISFKDLVHYAAHNRDLLAQEGNHLGAWHDPTDHKIFLDVSRVVKTPDEARDLSIKYDQRAYFDLQTFKSVPVNPNATSGGVVGPNKVHSHETPTAFAKRLLTRLAHQPVRKADGLEALRRRVARGKRVAKGDVEGHDFHGNQWTGGLAGADRPASELASIPEYHVGHGDGPAPVSVVGVHYSQVPRSVLHSSMYGTGMRGGEAARLRDAADPRIRQRVYFYVDTGKGTRPEDGVGAVAHTVRLTNLYEPKSDNFAIWREGKGDANASESAIIKHGYDGYYVDDFGVNQGVAVLLGPHRVPVQLGKLAKGDTPGHEFHGNQWTDGGGGTEKPFVVYRLGAPGAPLEDVNAGNAEGVAQHIMRLQSDEGPANAQGHGQSVTAYEVTLHKPAGEYTGYNAGRPSDASRTGAVGRVASRGAIGYSFPKGAPYTARAIGSVPLSSLHATLAQRGYSNFDDSGATIGAQVIRDAFGKVAMLGRLGKEFTQSSSPTSGITAYGNSRRTQRLRAIKRRKT